MPAPAPCGLCGLRNSSQAHRHRSGEVACRDEGRATATAAAASTYDAELEATSFARADLVAQPIRLNLIAREHLAAAFSASSASSVALEIMTCLAAVQPMIAASGNTSVDAQALTSLFIAAGGGAHIR